MLFNSRDGDLIRLSMTWRAIHVCLYPELSVSNDGGSTGSAFSPHARATFMDYAAVFDGSASRFELPSVLRSAGGGG